MICSYSEEFRTYDSWIAYRVQPDQAPQFYENRTRLLKEWLYSGDAIDEFSQSEKDFLIQQYESLETPFKVDYSEGWQQIASYSMTVAMLGAIIVGYLLSGLFAGEFQVKSDALFFSSFHGRNMASIEEVKAGRVLVTSVYWAMWLTYSGVVLAYLGADG